MNVTPEVREKLVHKFTKNRDGWDKLAAAMIMPLKTKYSYHSVLRVVLDGYTQPETPVQTRTITVEVGPEAQHLDRSMDLIRAWMGDAEEATIRDLFQQPRLVTMQEFLWLWDEHPLLLANGYQFARIRKHQEPIEGYQQVQCSRFAPETQVALFGKQPRGGWRLVDLTIEVKNLLPEVDGRHGARLEVTMSWQDDHLPATVTCIIEP